MRILEAQKYMYPLDPDPDVDQGGPLNIWILWIRIWIPKTVLQCQAAGHDELRAEREPGPGHALQLAGHQDHRQGALRLHVQQ
jgi:hypothetical protein